jgi:hypothetical protein
MFTFKVHFSRYRDSEIRISAPHWLHSISDFRDATAIASMMVTAMQGADPDSKYSIVSISTDVYGTQCNGARMFETAEELTARVQKDSPPADKK